MSDTCETELITDYKLHIKNLRLKLGQAYIHYEEMCNSCKKTGETVARRLAIESFEKHLEDLETQLEYHKKAVECLEGKI